MSLEAMSAVWRHSKSEGRARLILLAIADHLGEIGAWPSLETLATMANASRSSVQRDIRALESLGELTVIQQGAPVAGQYKSNLFLINLPGVSNPNNVAVDEQKSGVSNTTSGVSTGTSGVSNTTSGVSTGTSGVSNTTSGVSVVDLQTQLTQLTQIEPKEPFAKSRTLPKDFSLTDDMISWSKKQHPGFDPQLEFEKFTNWHTAKGSTMKNWDAAWRTWVLNSLKFTKPELANDPWAHLDGNK